MQGLSVKQIFAAAAPAPPRLGRALVSALRVLALAAPLLTCAAPAQAAAGEYGYADESRDWGVAASERLRQPPYHAPTPTQVPGAQVVQTRQLQAMLAAPTPPVLIDVLSEPGHLTLAGAVWMPGIGRGENFVDPVQSLVVQLLGQLAPGDKTKPMVFFCAGPDCWLSYNAAQRASAAGYTNVYWYRGGVAAWTAAGLPTGRTAGGR